MATHNAARAADLPGVDAVGRGYDVINGFFADTRSLIGLPLFDYGSDTKTVEVYGTTYSYPALMSFGNTPGFEGTQESGKDIETYRQDVSVNVGVEGEYKLFKASLDSDFSIEDQRQIETFYCSTTDIHRLWILTLPTATKLRENLEPVFADDLEKLAPADLFKRYGAYYVGEIVVGGRLDYTSATKMLKTSTSQELNVTSQASYDAMIGKIKVTAGSQLDKDITSYRQYSNIRLTAVGGDTTLASDILHGSDPQKAFTEWADSIKEYPTMMEFTQESLRPIWDLASTAARQAELKAAFDDYIATAPAPQPIVKTTAVLAITTDPLMVRDGTVVREQVKRLSVYVPVEYKNYSWIGQYAQPDVEIWDGGRTPVLRDLYDLGLLQPPMKWQKKWESDDYGWDKSYSCWRAIPPQGYRAIGDVMVLGTSKLREPNDEGYMCVHESVCSDITSLSDAIWKAGKSHKIRLWKPGSEDELPAGTFVVLQHHYDTTAADLDTLKGIMACIKQSAMIPQDEVEEIERRQAARREAELASVE